MQIQICSDQTSWFEHLTLSRMLCLSCFFSQPTFQLSSDPSATIPPLCEFCTCEEASLNQGYSV